MPPKGTKPADAVSGEYADLLAAASRTFPPSVILKDGESVAGTFVRLDSAPTRDYGNQPVVVFNDAADGAEKCMWLLHLALKTQFKRAKPAPGDKFVVVKLGKRQAAKSGHTYDDYRVVVAGADGAVAGAPISFDDIDTGDDAPAE